MMEVPRDEVELAERHSRDWRGLLKQTIREDRYSSADVPAGKRFDACQAELSSLLEIEHPVEGGDMSAFEFNARGYDLGKLTVAVFDVGAFRFRRTGEQVRRNEADHWMLSFRRSGSVNSMCGKRHLSCGAGQLNLTSFAYPFEGEVSAGDVVALCVPRDQLLGVADRLDRLNHRRVTGMTAQIAIEFLTSMERLLPHSPVSDIPIFVETAMIVLKGLADQANDDDPNPARPMMVLRLEMVKRYIEENLLSAELEPDDICAKMKISRRQLYYLFDRLGGVSNYVRNCRLRRFHEAVSCHVEDRPIHVLAAAMGFHDAALFSRQFKARFGYSPKEARDAKLFGYMPARLPPRTLSEWFGQVRL